MPRKSKIKHLPIVLKEAINGLLLSGKYTYQEVADHINSLNCGDRISKSSVGRYSKIYLKLMENYQAYQEVSKSYAGVYGESDIAKMNVERLGIGVAQLQHRLEEELVKESLNSEEIVLLTRIVKDLAETSLKLSKSKQLIQSFDEKIKLVKTRVDGELKKAGLNSDDIAVALKSVFGDIVSE